jgi:diacylglycerol kinase (ATP)
MADAATRSGTILINPGAGNSRAGATRQRLADLVGPLGIEIVPTESAEDLERKACSLVLRGERLIIAAGGDDTVRAALRGMKQAGYFSNAELRQSTTFGILPLGTFNNFANHLGVPSDFEAALFSAVNSPLRQVDLGVLRMDSSLDEVLFTESVGLGLDVETWKQFPKEDPNVWRRIWDGIGAFLKALRIFRPKRYQISAVAVGSDMALVSDTWSCRPLQISVANSGRFSAGIPIAPDARRSDGLLDLTVVPGTAVFSWVGLSLMFVGLHQNFPGVRYEKIREIRLQCRWKSRIRVDAILKGPFRRVVIRVLPGILPIRLPD